MTGVQTCALPICFDDRLVERAIASRRNEYSTLSDDFLRMALQRFLTLRDRPLRKQPATGELLVWLRVLALAVGTYPERLEEDLARLPYIGVLLKDRQDIEELAGGARALRAKVVEDKSVNEMMLVLADCLLEAVQRSLTDDAIREQLSTYAES